ncbi:unnamed protein product [Eretmochelys imbricata]
MRVGWARPDVRPDVELGADDLAYVFNGHRGQRWHVGSEPFGRSWQPGDVVGCMIDLTENHIMFTLNGEMLISDSGSELAFKDIEIGEGFLPVCSLGLAQVGRLNLGQEVSSLRYFPICGLQEGFEPFAINMKRDISMWFSKRPAAVLPHPPRAPPLRVVSRIDGTVDNPPCLKLTHRTFGSQNAVSELLFLRLSMPVEFHEKFKCTAGAMPLTRALTIPEEDVKDVDLDSEFEVLRKSPGVRRLRRPRRRSRGGPCPAPRSPPGRRTRRMRRRRRARSREGLPVQGEEGHVQRRAPGGALRAAPGGRRGARRPGRPRDHHEHHHVLPLSAIFAGQEPTCVWVGWVTPDYHQHDMTFDLSKVRTVTVTMGDDQGHIHDRHRGPGARLPGGLATGLMTFTANGKEINTFYQVEPNTKLFPAVFVLPTSQNVFQFELGKMKNIMPLSAAMFHSERKNPSRSARHASSSRC